MITRLDKLLPHHLTSLSARKQISIDAKLKQSWAGESHFADKMVECAHAGFVWVCFISVKNIVWLLLQSCIWDEDIFFALSPAECACICSHRFTLQVAVVFLLKKGPKASPGLNQIRLLKLKIQTKHRRFPVGKSHRTTPIFVQLSLFIWDTKSQRHTAITGETSTEHSPTGTLVRISVSIETAANPLWDTMQQLFGTGMYVRGMFWELFSLISQNQNACQHTKSYKKQRNQLGCQLSISRSYVFRKKWFFRQRRCSLLWVCSAAVLQVIRRRHTNPGKAHSWGA